MTREVPGHIFLIQAFIMQVFVGSSFIQGFQYKHESILNLMLCFLALHGHQNKSLFFTDVSEYLQSKRYFLMFLTSLFFVFGPQGFTFISSSPHLQECFTICPAFKYFLLQFQVILGCHVTRNKSPIYSVLVLIQQICLMLIEVYLKPPIIIAFCAIFHSCTIITLHI